MKLSFGCAELFSALNNAIKLADNSIDLSEEIINYLSKIIDEQTNEVASTSWDVDFYSYIRNLKKRMKRYIKKVLATMKSSVLALKQRLFNIASRQSANAQYVDGLVASIPIPPHYGVSCLSEHRDTVGGNMERNTGISKRTTIYGKDAEGQSKRFCDIVLIDGSPCLEVKDRYGHKVWASVDAAKAAIHELTKNNKT